jgi:crotonobetainyl-CoA:carnitine CoA-transferase CaiB-like acyl-CoA transferase
MLLADLGADVVRVDRTEPSGLGVPMAARTTSTAATGARWRWT